MLKSGLIFGGVAFVLTAITGLLNAQLCGPCLVLLVGAGAGYLGSTFDKPRDNAGSARSGAGAGAIGGLGALLGHVIGGLIGISLLGPERAVEFARQLGLPTTGLDPNDPASLIGFYGGTVGIACCFGLLDIVLMAGVGALGGLLWYQITGKNAAPPLASQ